MNRRRHPELSVTLESQVTLGNWREEKVKAFRKAKQPHGSRSTPQLPPAVSDEHVAPPAPHKVAVTPAAAHSWDARCWEKGDEFSSYTPTPAIWRKVGAEGNESLFPDLSLSPLDCQS